MAYLQSSIKEALSMNRKQLEAALQPHNLFPLSKWTKDELVALWLELYGVKELSNG